MDQMADEKLIKNFSKQETEILQSLLNNAIKFQQNNPNARFEEYKAKLQETQNSCEKIISRVTSSDNQR